MFNRLLQAVRKLPGLGSKPQAQPVEDQFTEDQVATEQVVATLPPEAVTFEAPIKAPATTQTAEQPVDPADPDSVGEFVLGMATEVRLAAGREENITERELAATVRRSEPVEKPEPVAETPQIPKPRPKRLPFDRTSVTFD